jgi:hypothetical protein
MAKAKPPKWRLRIYVSPPLVHKVRLAAARDEQSVSSFCRKLIARAVARVEAAFCYCGNEFRQFQNQCWLDCRRGC